MDDLKVKSVDELVHLRKMARRLDDFQRVQFITDELALRGFYDVPRLCSCQEYAGDNCHCPIHGRSK